MAERLNIDKITSSTEDWTCEVQVIDKGHCRSNRDGDKKYQLMILQDEEKKLLLLIPAQHKLLEKTFTIQIKRLFAKNQNTSSAKLFIMSITDKDIASNPPLPHTATATPESSKRKLKQIMTKED